MKQGESSLEQGEAVAGAVGTQLPLVLLLLHQVCCRLDPPIAPFCFLKSRGKSSTR